MGNTYFLWHARFERGSLSGHRRPARKISSLLAH
jgi:hypothetical protein